MGRLSSVAPRDLRLLRAVFQLLCLHLKQQWPLSLHLQLLHLPLAPSVTIERLPGRSTMALIAHLIRFALTKSAARMQSGQKRGFVASAATKQAMGIPEMYAVTKHKIERICAGVNLRSFSFSFRGLIVGGNRIKGREVD